MVEEVAGELPEPLVVDGSVRVERRHDRRQHLAEHADILRRLGRHGPAGGGTRPVPGTGHVPMEQLADQAQPRGDAALRAAAGV